MFKRWSRTRGVCRRGVDTVAIRRGRFEHVSHKRWGGGRAKRRFWAVLRGRLDQLGKFYLIYFRRVLCGPGRRTDACAEWLLWSGAGDYAGLKTYAIFPRIGIVECEKLEFLM